MASGTDHKTPHPEPMRATPPTTQAHPPALIEGTDAVLLLRLYPDKFDLAGARAAAVAQGKATAEAGEVNVAAQQQPVVVLGA
jgi:hypothetical protein